MQNVFFIDETLDKNLTHIYHLSIQASLNGLSFCILDPVTNKYIVLCHKSFDENLSVDDITLLFDEYIESNELLNNKKYKSSSLIWLSEKNLLVPDILFSKDDLKKHFEFIHQLDELDEIHYNKLKQLDAYSVFAIPNLAANLFAKHFKGIRFYNQQHILIEGIIGKPLHGKFKLSVFVHDYFIDIAITEAHKVLLINSFKYKSHDDIVYYILLAIEQLNLNNDNCELILSGFIEKNAKAYMQLQKYIKHIKFDHLPESINYSYTFDKIPHHRFSNLFKLVQCE